MITFYDTQKLIKVMARYFYTKEETDSKFYEFGKKMDLYQATLLHEIEGLKEDRQEIKILVHDMVEVQKWMRPVSSKTGVDYPF